MKTLTASNVNCKVVVNGRVTLRADRSAISGEMVSLENLTFANSRDDVQKFKHP